MARESIREQLRRNAVALISLVIAITSLGYNTWRNEHSEYNRNQRWASFNILLKLGELQELVFLNHYDCNMEWRGNVRTGWVLVQTIEDLTLVLDARVEDVGQLRVVWAANFQGIEYESEEACRNRSAERRASGDTAQSRIRAAIGALREDVLTVLAGLD